MRLRAILFAVVAIVIALGTAQLARNWLAGQRAALEAQKKVEKPVNYVLVAARDLPTGSFVRPEDMTWAAWPEGQTAESYMRKGKDSEQSLVGSVVRSRVAAGEPLTPGRVVKPGDRGFLAAVLSPGMRAVSVSVTATSGIAGLVFPGDRVDLVLSHNIKPPTTPNDPNSGQVRVASETVLTDLRVLAIDQTTDDQNGKPVIAKNVTFEVTPKQVEAIEVASDLGKLNLSLRSLGHPDDQGIVNAAGPAESYTWDSDVSKLLPPPPRRGGAPAKGTAVAERHLTVLRGGSSASDDSSVAERAQPASATPEGGVPVGKPIGTAAGHIGGSS
jgi:pilus assembly protein CpaB